MQPKGVCESRQSRRNLCGSVPDRQLQGSTEVSRRGLPAREFWRNDHLRSWDRSSHAGNAEPSPSQDGKV